MFKKIKRFIVKYRDEILYGLLVVFIGISVMLGIFTTALVAISNDLVGVIDTKEAEIEKLKTEVKDANVKVNLANAKVDEIQQTYEDVVPKQQYLDDIEYLESVIYELRGQCEIDLKKAEESCKNH